MNLPNKITILRIILIPIAVYLLVCRYDVYAVAIFILASASDAVDGYIARKKNLITDFGKIMDPLADKLLVYSLLITLVSLDRVPFYLVIICLARDFLVEGLRTVASSKGSVIAAGMSGKIKTVVQMISIVALMLNNYPFSLFTDFRVDKVLFLVSVVLCVYSGIIYIKKNAKFFKG